MWTVYAAPQQQTHPAAQGPVDAAARSRSAELLLSLLLCWSQYILRPGKSAQAGEGRTRQLALLRAASVEGSKLVWSDRDKGLLLQMKRCVWLDTAGGWRSRRQAVVQEMKAYMDTGGMQSVMD